MSDDRTAPTQVEWHWEWVPPVRPGEPEHEVWTERMVALFEEWTSEGLAAVRAVWPADAGTEFPFTSDMLGRDAATWLRERADQLPVWSRLAWGAVFVNGRPRWAPVPVVVEFCGPVAEDPNYLMDVVGARGVESDAREPVIDYVTTPIGDGLRVFALCRGAEGAGYARVHAALRLDVPPSGGAPGVSTDVLLATFVFEMGLMALIGAGVELLMQQIADECAPGDAGRARLGFVAATEGAQP
ncbi:hypothetical protein G3I60_02875 [Streptomyces sp. SID13666]|uniref:hypothetical protein n=1 Tax=unclassified Streptomyces TaxID=2593676 RepID=UPI0013C11BDC|nr:MULTISPECIES: hypothetical protein [unclassified Streptomyces]NEA53143.1 hypothetical protein [Streptomyces sp. SID13666]NEA69530.1 hypothetical protein [Streptomyces sp. SID13588]